MIAAGSSMSGAQETRLLKSDGLGRVEHVVGADGSSRVRRVACGGRMPGSSWVARTLLARERRALEALDGFRGVPRLLASEKGILERSWIAGAPLSRAETLPEDFFDRLDELVVALHGRGVCHNDLHKEQNVLVTEVGRPALVDFQLASVHRERGRIFESRVRDDLRHVEKHRRRYTRDGRGPAGTGVSRGRGEGIRRSWIAFVWRRGIKPAYVLVTRAVFRGGDGEERRPSTGPWPRWTRPIGAPASGYWTSSR
jgi:predicted Ser/Thr protein kinase